MQSSWAQEKFIKKRYSQKKSKLERYLWIMERKITLTAKVIKKIMTASSKLFTHFATNLIIL
tara:strand:+ start:87 stop:272 length:186 start_codon:yes stop_codon:yes gene_type:complete